jgi:hypothetical protein
LTISSGTDYRGRLTSLSGSAMRLQKTVVTDKPPGKVFDYLSDFTSTTDWDPGTVTTVRQHGPFLPAGTDPAREPGRSRPAPGAQPTA